MAIYERQTYGMYWWRCACGSAFPYKNCPPPKKSPQTCCQCCMCHAECRGSALLWLPISDDLANPAQTLSGCLLHLIRSCEVALSSMARLTRQPWTATGVEEPVCEGSTNGLRRDAFTVATWCFSKFRIVMQKMSLNWQFSYLPLSVPLYFIYPALHHVLFLPDICS